MFGQAGPPLSIHTEAEADATRAVLIKALRTKYGKVASMKDLLQAATDDKPIWFLWKSKSTDILLVPQHYTQALMISYTINSDANQDKDVAAARNYLKKANPKAEAQKL